MRVEKQKSTIQIQQAERNPYSNLEFLLTDTRHYKKKQYRGGWHYYFNIEFLQFSLLEPPCA
jgi:hypothetical protein